MKGRPISNEFREKCKQRSIGNKNPMYGKHHSQKTKNKISNTRK